MFNLLSLQIASNFSVQNNKHQSFFHWGGGAYAVNYNFLLGEHLLYTEIYFVFHVDWSSNSKVI